MSNSTPVRAAGEVLTHRQTLTVMVGLMLGMFLSSLDQTIVSTSIYTIANDLDGLSLQAWATTAYLITSTVSTPLYGKLSDIFGRRPLYLTAILIFLAGSLYAGSVHSMTELAIARGIQGLGAGGLLALALTIIGDIVALKDRAKYQGYFMSVFGISSVLGPVIGGAFAGSANILGFDGWRWVFFINLPIGLAALVVVFMYLHLPVRHVKQKIDYWGAAAITLAIVPLLLVAEQGRTWGWSSAGSWLCYGLGVIGIVAFLLAEKRAGDYALIPLRLFKNTTFGLSSLLNFIIGIGMFGAIAMLPMYLQLVKGLTPTEAGLMMITFTVGILFGSISAGRTISNSGVYRIFPIMGTAVLAGAATVMGLVLGVDTGLWVPGLIAVFFGVGLGFCMQPLTLAMQVSVPPKDMGVGTSTAAFFRSMGGAVGTAVFISMLFSTAADKIADGMKTAASSPDYQAVMRDPAVASDPANAKLFDFFKNGANNDSLNDTSWLHSANSTLTRPITEGFAQAIDVVMLTAAGLMIIAFLISFALPNKKLTDPKAAAKDSVPAH
ncbi:MULTISPECIES: MDR family MFS transporter [Paenarthrobacter]|jgi:EmrB/QacA subfamily drug resistance transporter|uniref:EmrB/QacA subfamily drug resistance transporter n=1 Tax=Paenarthrobacter nicotinovorans TaxID=29320 RepID=A0ABT9TR28_PAENI|nr:MULTISPECIES: MDR family MFS transporter [Paenarthrobacter]KIA71188.1 emrB/QacA family drug resistance transporter [Arthrobacter sp. MWB30]KQR01981.1 MFS transporter [Arthrobacter sp. Leaf145]SKC06395.1 drug resistance transporter, EmrB/QacA subfamily [Arthrobacter sp. 31Cvi3.1E]BCW12489.1 MFS transporter [Arthrobacter sp. NtRootA2]BCW16572.1 MFS transporter [Arthrobacter sp. NtRootA4]BCW24905.1 MFS transporter [Arthrobacter sp. NtRootC7]BCW29174.1 MFS transporter [Arthrobacter sp. NtRoot